MPIRRTSKAIASVALALALLTVATRPAAAVNVTITAGTLDLRNPSGVLIGGVGLTNPQCTSPPPSTVTTTSGTTITATLRLHTLITVQANDFILELTVNMTGNHAGSSPYSASGTTTATIVARKSVGCVPLGGTCTITASNIGWSGTVTAADIHALVTTDSMTWSGANPVFNTVVVGTVPNCGALIQLNNGRFVFSGVTLHV